jgi:hypothetical protein
MRLMAYYYLYQPNPCVLMYYQHNQMPTEFSVKVLVMPLTKLMACYLYQQNPTLLISH